MGAARALVARDASIHNEGIAILLLGILWTMIGVYVFVGSIVSAKVHHQAPILHLGPEGQSRRGGAATPLSRTRPRSFPRHLRLGSGWLLRGG